MIDDLNLLFNFVRSQMSNIVVLVTTNGILSIFFGLWIVRKVSSLLDRIR